LTKFSYRDVGAPKAASLRHLYSLGKKSFFIWILDQQSGNLFAKVNKASRQNVV
jgi:hypothetical protein